MVILSSVKQIVSRFDLEARCWVEENLEEPREQPPLNKHQSISSSRFIFLRIITYTHKISNNLLAQDILSGY